MSGKDRPQAIGASKVIGSDDMFTVRRFEHPPRDPDPAPVVTFRETLALRLMWLEAHFTGQNWPPFSPRVFVGDADGNGWAPISDDWEAALTADGIDPRVEVPAPEADMRIECGLNFIRRRVPAFTLDYWLITEAAAIKRVLGAQTQDAALEAAHALGILHQQAHDHERHLPAVRKKLRQERPLKAAAKENPANAKRRAEAEQFRALAREIADKSKAKGGALMLHVKRELERQGIRRELRSIQRALRLH